jgi:hypothetical protein
VREAIGRAYDEKFTFLFKQLAIAGTADIVARHVKAPALHHSAPTAAAPDDATLSD